MDIIAIGFVVLTFIGLGFVIGIYLGHKKLHSDGNSNCPGCDGPIDFEKDAKIELHCETAGFVPVPGMLIISSPCQNPTCEWSRVKPGSSTYLDDIYFP